MGKKKDRKKKRMKRKSKTELVYIHPMLPTKYSSKKREELCKFEKELLAGREVKIWGTTSKEH